MRPEAARVGKDLEAGVNVAGVLQIHKASRGQRRDRPDVTSHNHFNKMSTMYRRLLPLPGNCRAGHWRVPNKSCPPQNDGSEKEIPNREMAVLGI